MILNFVGNVSAARDGQSLLGGLAYQAVILRQDTGQITPDILIKICTLTLSCECYAIRPDPDSSAFLQSEVSDCMNLLRGYGTYGSDNEFSV